MPEVARFLPLFLILSLASSACSSDSPNAKTTETAGAAGSSAGPVGGSNAQAHGSAGTATGGGAGSSTGSGVAGASSGGAPMTLPTSVLVHLIPQQGISGAQRVNFAVPLAPGQLSDATRLQVLSGGTMLPAFSRSLARYRDGSSRSVQIQIDLAEATEQDIEVRLGESPTAAPLSAVPVEQTLVDPNGEQGPKVWALLPAAWLSGSGFAGPLVPESAVADQPSAAWASLCDYAANDVEAFLASGYETDRAVWLFDRGTALYRGYARRGDLSPLRSAYIETSIYRNRITGTGSAARNGIGDDAADDVKYNYSQNLALHYLLSGDDRFRESAEDIALGMAELWTDPGYAGGDDFWTERHAGFGLLAYDWAMIVSDDRAAEFRSLADDAVNAYVELQTTYPAGYADENARCFAHTASAHGEGGAYFGCSPWMSAILADALAQYALESDAARAEQVRDALIKLGRIIAQRGIQADGRPYYFMGVGTAENMPEEYDEHYGESAYLIGMSWHFSGRNEAALRGAADQLLARMASDGSAPHVRSFNWQCRSAVAGPWYLQ
ncbi:MAG TPA: hypothetical protein VJN18_35480 [Polyangiaceae bacterium]|nr:hypothetical protein [Polyangiaceae bacterium]